MIAFCQSVFIKNYDDYQSSIMMMMMMRQSC